MQMRRQLEDVELQKDSNFDWKMSKWSISLLQRILSWMESDKNSQTDEVSLVIDEL